MLRLLLLSALLVTYVQANDTPASGYNCAYSNTLPKPVCHNSDCTDAIQGHIKVELEASFSYLYLAAHFDSIHKPRPGLAKFFYEASAEEREHAIMFLEYLNSRGIKNGETSFTFDINKVWVKKNQHFETLLLDEFRRDESYENALKLATNLEIKVTRAIHGIIKKCDTDYHAADYLTEPILAEQHEGIRKLQGAIKELNNMKTGATISNFNEYLLDQKLLSGSL